MWKIGNVKINGKVVLAPMAGITSLSYREFLKPFGVAYSVTEMISVDGICYHNQKTIEYLKTSKKDSPVAIQLFGSKLNTTLKAMDIINNELKIKYDILDFNFGCPVRKVINSNAGSAWLKNPKKLYMFMKSVVEHSPKPVTAKIRLGFDDKSINFREVIKALEDAGVKAIAIHARTTKELYSGLPHYDLLKDLQKEMKVPLIVSGNIFTLDDAINALKITKATAVMVARGAVGNPYLVKQIDTYLKNKKRLDNVDPLTNIIYCQEIAKALVKEKGERTAISIMRTIAPQFFKNLSNAKHYRNKLSQTINTYKDLCNVLLEISNDIKKN